MPRLTWKKPNLIGGLILIIIAVGVPVLVAILNPEGLKVLAEIMSIKYKTYSISLFALIGVGGLVWIIWPTIQNMIQTWKNRK